MKLTAKQRSALFAGDPPKITFPAAKPCPVKVGHVEVLSAHVKLEVTAIRRTKKGEWALVYTLFNNRIGDRYLAPQAGQLHPQQYQSNGPSSVDPEGGAAVDEFTQRRITEASKLKEREAIGDLLVTLGELRAVVKERLERSPDARRIMGRDAWALRTKIDSVERRLKRRHAA